MSTDRETLKRMHSVLIENISNFAEIVVNSADGRVLTEEDLNHLTIDRLGASRVRVFRKNGWCYIYDDEQGVCRLCTPEEDQGTIDLPP